MSGWSVQDELGWALLFLFGPGLAVGAALGLRRVWLLAVAPAASVAVLGAGAVLLDLVGMPWGRLGALVVTVVAVVCVLLSLLQICEPTMVALLSFAAICLNQ